MTSAMEILGVALYLAADISVLALLAFGDFEDGPLRLLAAAGLKKARVPTVAGLPSGFLRYEPNRPGFAAYVAALALVALTALWAGWPAA